MIAQNDFSSVELPFTIVIVPPEPSNGGGFPWWGILLIVLGCVAGAAIAYFAWKRYKAKQAVLGTEGNDTNKSLLEREA